MQRIFHTPEGVRDIYSQECSRKQKLQEKLHRVFHQYGFEDIETPTFEYFEVFSKEVGTIPSRELYKFFDREGNTLVLRPDFTPSVSRACATYFNPEKEVVSLCYTGNTFINNSSFRGRLKETTQMGVERMGDDSPEADAEILAMTVECLLATGLTEFQVSVGQVDYYKAILNPLWNKQFGSKNSSRKFELREALKLEYLPIDALRLSLDFSLSRNDGTVEVFKSAQHNDFYEEKDPSLKGSYDWTKNENTSYRLRLSGAYNKSWGDHLLAAFASYSINESQLKTTALSMKGFPNDRLSEVYMGTEFQNTTGNENMTRALAFVMTLNYSYKQRYAVDYSMSINASSEFGKNNRYAPFWSAGLRWNAEKEEFIKNWGIFDELILRGTYGITGSQGFTPYQSLQMYTYSNLMKTYKSSEIPI